MGFRLKRFGGMTGKAEARHKLIMRDSEAWPEWRELQTRAMSRGTPGTGKLGDNPPEIGKGELTTGWAKEGGEKAQKKGG